MSQGGPMEGGKTSPGGGGGVEDQYENNSNFFPYLGGIAGFITLHLQSASFQ